MIWVVHKDLQELLNLDRRLPNCVPSCGLRFLALSDVDHILRDSHDQLDHTVSLRITSMLECSLIRTDPADLAL